MWQWHYSFCSYSFFPFFERADFFSSSFERTALLLWKAPAAATTTFLFLDSSWLSMSIILLFSWLWHSTSYQSSSFNSFLRGQLFFEEFLSFFSSVVKIFLRRKIMKKSGCKSGTCPQTQIQFQVFFSIIVMTFLQIVEFLIAILISRIRFFVWQHFLVKQATCWAGDSNLKTLVKDFSLKLKKYFLVYFQSRMTGEQSDRFGAFLSTQRKEIWS